MWTRRTFLEALSTGSLATRHVTPRRPSLLSGRDAVQPSPASPRAEMMREGELVIERPLTGRPHAGKVLAAIQPHSDDLPLFAATPRAARTKGPSALEEALAALEPDQITPKEALEEIYRLRRLARGE